MVCLLCDKVIGKTERCRLVVRGREYFFHIKCLRKASKKQLVDKSIIESTDHSWRLLNAYRDAAD